MSGTVQMRSLIAEKIWIRILIALLFVGIAMLLTGKLEAADSEDDAARMSRPLLKQNGQLFVVQFAPGSRRLDVFAAGKSVATLDPSQITVFGRVYPLKGQPRELKIVWEDGHYQVAEPVENSTPIEVEVARKVDDQKRETFRFDKTDDGAKSKQAKKKSPTVIPR